MIGVYDSCQVRGLELKGNDIKIILFADLCNHNDFFNDPLSPQEIESFDSFDLIMLLDSGEYLVNSPFEIILIDPVTL